MLRQPIVCVLGHVDHGKTSILDAIRKTSLAKKEAGLITQHIGASEVPRDAIEEVCGSALAQMKIKLEVPGILFIDTPGHAAFSNLRERGGSIADIAVLVIDINQGFQPQTIESIGILKGFKTPFIIAANKVDVIEGWKGGSGNCIAQSIKRQNERVQARLDELLYTLVGRMGELGMNAERFDRIEDFTKQIALVPVSAKTGEGVLELLLFLAGLSQKFLESGLDAKEGSPACGSILEVREERGLGTIIDAIIYEGVLKQNDIIVFGTINGAEKTKVRSIIKPKPASRIVNPQEKYDYPKEAAAACGVRIFAPGLETALSGSPFAAANTPEEQTAQSEVIEGQIKKVVFEKSEHGVVAKAESLGSLEAMLNLLEVEKIPVRKSGIGEISKKDALEARRSGGEDSALSAVFGFGVKASREAEVEEAAGGVKILTNEVIYSLIEDYKKWVCSCREREKCELLSTHIYPVKLKILPGCCFRKSNPAIFGVEVLAGKLLVKCPLMNSGGKEIGEVKGVQNKNEAAQSAEKGEQVAISVDGAFFGKDVGEGDVLYAHLTEREWGEISKKCRCALSKEEEKLLGEILSITSTSRF